MKDLCDYDCFNCKFYDCILPLRLCGGEGARTGDYVWMTDGIKGKKEFQRSAKLGNSQKIKNLS